MLLHSYRTERPRGFRLTGEIDLSNEATLSSMLAPEVALDILGATRAPGLVIVDVPVASHVPTDAHSGTARDLAGGTHPVTEARCACGCRYLHAADDLALFWEPGGQVDDGCTDHGCGCHVSPLRG